MEYFGLDLVIITNTPSLYIGLGVFRFIIFNLGYIRLYLYDRNGCMRPFLFLRFISPSLNAKVE